MYMYMYTYMLRVCTVASTLIVVCTCTYNNLKGVGNISKHYVEPVVWSFFRRCLRRRKHKPRQHPHSPKPSSVYIFTNKKLRELISKGPNFREQFYVRNFVLKV